MADIQKSFAAEGGISLDDIVGIFTGPNDPTFGIGEEAPVGSLFLRQNGELYQKTGTPDTSWTRFVQGADVGVGVSSNDTNPSFLNLKLVAGAGLTKQILNPNANETLEISMASVGTAGTYTSVTTNARGQVIAGSNPVVVTSVAVTPPSSGLIITGGPITSTGTFVFLLANDLAALEALTGTGLARRTGVDTWSLDTNTYLTGNQNITLTGDITGSGTTAIGTTLATVNASPQSDTFRKITVNGKGLVTNTSAVGNTDITTALGFAPYDAANPAGYTANLGTVTSASIITANGFAGDVANNSTTPAISLTTTVTGMIKGNGTAISAAAAGTDYSAGTAALGTGILRSTTGTGTLSIAVAANFPTLNQSTTGSAATWTTGRTIAHSGDMTGTSGAFNGSANITIPMTLATVNTNVGQFVVTTVNGKGLVTSATNLAATGDVTGTSSGSSINLTLSTVPVSKGGTNLTTLGTALQVLRVNAAGTNLEYASASTGTVTSISALQPLSGITISGGPITTSGTLTFTLANDLAAVEGLSSTGFAVRSATDTWTTRSLASGIGIGITNADGVLADPTIGLSSVGTAGTYNNVTTNAQGQVTSGSNVSYVLSSEKGAANGVATLDAGGKLPIAQLPALAISETFVVVSQAAQIALTAQVGDVAIRTDLNKSFILQTEPASDIANWQELLTPTDSVTSVNGQTGAVTVGTITSIAAAAPSAGFTISGSPITTAGTLTFALANDLAALESLAGIGLARRTGTDTWSLDTSTYLTGNQSISITGDGTGTGTTSITLTLATVNSAPQTNAFRKVTVNSKGLVTATSAVVLGDITTALGFTPYNATNPAGYTSNTGTVTSVDMTAPAAGITVAGGPVTTTGFITLSLANDLAALEGLSGVGLARRTGADTWSLDTNTYLTANQTITASGDATGSGTTTLPLTLATVNSSPQTDTFRKITVNGKGLVIATSSVASSDIIATLGFTPYNATNPNGYTTNVGTVTSVNLTAPAAGITFSGGPITTSGSITAALANDLAAVEGLTATGIVRRTAADTWTAGTLVNLASEVTDNLPVTNLNSGINASSGTYWRGDGTWAAGNAGTVTSISATAPTAGITISGSPVTSSGTLTFALANDLAAVEGLSSTGIAVRTAADTWATRSITNGTGITVSNGDGVSGNITITNSGVTSAVGTTNQVNVSASTGAVTFSLPQNIHAGATPSFAQVSVAVDPTSALQVATKQYVDNAVTGLDFKQSVRVGTTANITLSGSQVIDGVTVVAGNRVLVKDQSTASQNGIYVVSVGAWTRSTDADDLAEVTAGLFTFIEQGAVNSDSGWVLTSDNPITVGTTALTFVQFTGTGQILAGSGLTKTGQSIDIGTASSSRIVVNTDNIDLATIGTAGTYGQVTVDAYGRVTAGAVNVVASGGTGLTGLGSANQVLTVNGAGTALTYTTPTVGTVTLISAVQPAAGITVSGGPITSAGTLTFALANDLAALEALSGTGLARRTAVDTWSLDTNTYLTGNQSISLTGDATGSGTTSIGVTLATVNTNVGQFAVSTVNGKGLVTAATNLAATGDATGTSSGAGLALTLATVNSSAGQFAVSTVNGKGLVTAATNLSLTGAITGTSSGAGLVTTYASTVPTNRGGTNLTTIGSSLQYLRVNAAGTGLEYATLSVASGSVTSVGLSLPSIFTVSGSPVTASGTLSAVLATQAANTFLGGPVTGTAAPTFRTIALDNISNITLTAPSANQVLAFNAGSSTWVNAGAVGANATGLVGSGQSGVAAWVSTGSGSRFRADFAHALGTTNVVVTLWDISNNQIVQGDIVTTTDANTVRVVAVGNTRTLKVVVIANGQSIVAGGSTPSSVITSKEGVTVNAAATKLNFLGGGVTVVDAGSGTSDVTIAAVVPIVGRFMFFANSLDTPNTADYAVNALAPVTTDPTYTSLSTRAFSQSAEQGVAFTIAIPAEVTSVTFKLKGRSQTTPGVSSVVQHRLYHRQLPNNSAPGAWSAAQELSNITVPTNQFFQYSSQTATMSSLGLVADRLYQFELTRRVTGVTGTNLNAPWLLVEVTLEFA